MNQSIPPVPSPPPPGNCGAFASLVSPAGRGFSQFSATGGPGIGQPRGHPRAFDTHVVNFKTWSTWRISEIKTRCFSCFYYTKVKELIWKAFLSWYITSYYRCFWNGYDIKKETVGFLELSRRNSPLFSLVLKLILVLPPLEVKSSFFKCFLSLL